MSASETLVTILSGFLSKFRIFVIVGIVLVLCVAVYAMAKALGGP